MEIAHYSFREVRMQMLLEFVYRLALTGQNQPVKMIFLK